jgi:hypothetical protein
MRLVGGDVVIAASALFRRGATSQKLQDGDCGDACRGGQKMGFHSYGSNEADVERTAKRILDLA